MHVVWWRIDKKKNMRRAKASEAFDRQECAEIQRTATSSLDTEKVLTASLPVSLCLPHSHPSLLLAVLRALSALTPLMTS